MGLVLTFPTLFADHPKSCLSFRIRETKPHNNSQEARDPSSGLPDSASERLWNNAAGRPSSRSPELEPSALPAPELRSKGWGRDLLETKNLSPIPGEGLFLRWVWPCKACACALGRGEGRGECLVGITWGPWVPARLCSQNSRKDGLRP